MSLKLLKPTINGNSIHDDLLNTFNYSQPPGITILDSEDFAPHKYITDAIDPGLHSPIAKYIVNDSFDYTYYYLDGEYFVCIDVECAAIGYGQFDSGPIFVPNLIDPLTEFTGLTSYDIINNGKLLDNVLLELHNRLYYLNKLYKHGVTIVGQSFNKYINAPPQPCDTVIDYKTDTLIDYKNTYLFPSFAIAPPSSHIINDKIIKNYIINANDFSTFEYKYTSPFAYAHHSTINNSVYMIMNYIFNAFQSVNIKIKSYFQLNLKNKNKLNILNNQNTQNIIKIFHHYLLEVVEIFHLHAPHYWYVLNHTSLHQNLNHNLNENLNDVNHLKCLDLNQILKRF